MVIKNKHKGFLSLMSIILFAFLAIASEEEPDNMDDCYKLDKAVGAAATLDITVNDSSTGLPIPNAIIVITYDHVYYVPPETDIGCIFGTYQSIRVYDMNTHYSDLNGKCNHSSNAFVFERDVDYYFFQLIVEGPEGSNYIAQNDNFRIYPYDEGEKELIYTLSK